MPKTKKRKRAQRLPALRWRDCGTLPSGSSYRQTFDGIFRLVKSDQCYGVALLVEYKLYRWRRNVWQLVLETRSKARAERTARQLAAALESEAENE